MNKTTNELYWMLRRNSSSQNPYEDPDILAATNIIDKSISPILYIFGFPGNAISFYLWQRPRLRHSSGYYLAALALTDLLFLVNHVLFELYKVWQVNLLEHPIICEALPIIHMAFQYLSPLLVLAFTVERYIAVCFPLRRQQFCTTKKAMIVTVCLSLLALGLGCMQGYFYQYDTQLGYCHLRTEAVTGGNKSIWSIWTWVTEMLIFLFVPLCILFLNVIIIREIRRLARSNESKMVQFQTVTTTFTLLLVSFYYIITSVPVSIVYAVRYEFLPSEQSTYSPDFQSKYRKFQLAKTIIEELGMTHFACKFYIFLSAEKLFRDEFIHVILRVFCKNKLHTSDYTQHTVLQTEMAEPEAETGSVVLVVPSDSEYGPDETIM
ncbi:hypothetical protein ACJMK2_044089 [Sinanodonta woodiana]|uniref:G-protein coupled receptors family 1 profile domain-containing protein n=1 Tax=Sinanodonta woodiana TaxID=1069815 RepID=A0ABD3W1T7_SINWO